MRLALFVGHLGGLHERAEGRPAVIGNCQAGWAVAMVAARRPELFGPLILAGSPLSYWAGLESENPMRFSGGLLGGSWLTALTSDLGAGKFDGRGWWQTSKTSTRPTPSGASSTNFMQMWMTKRPAISSSSSGGAGMSS